MKLKEFVNLSGMTALSMPQPEKEFFSVYIGDLLSWVMGRANPGCAWITIMSNINIVAVASLLDASVIILAENVKLEADVIRVANEKGINILSSSLPSYETAVLISELMK